MDYLIRNAQVVDGTGAPAYRADVLIKGGRIAKIDKSCGGAGVAESDPTQLTTIDAEGKYLTPGFIDVHRHADAAVFRPGFGEAELRQGLTSIINGNCGLSVIPCPPDRRQEILQFLSPVTGDVPSDVMFSDFGDYMEALPRELPLNVGMLIGNGTVRSAVAGYRAGELNEEEYKDVHRYIETACEEGAFGVSIGLQYAPEMYYNKDELIRALAPMRGYDVPLCTHTRGDGDSMMESLDEVIDIAHELDIPLQVSHFKNMGRVHWGERTLKALGKLDTARENGMTVHTDVYPYTYGTTQLIQIMPPSFLEGGMGALTERLKDKAMREKLKDIFEHGEPGFENFYKLLGWENFLLTTFVTEENKKYTGMSIPAIAEVRGTDCFNCVCDLLAEEQCRIGMIDYIVSEDDIRTIMKYSDSIFISDSTYPSTGRPHPRVYGTFTRILDTYVRDEGVIDIETAVAKMSGLPAKWFHIANKGLIREGYDADINLFDIAAIRTNASLEDPAQCGDGFSYVFVGGEPAVVDGRVVNSTRGRRLLRR